MRLYGLIGYPLSHSFSKQFFDAKFEREGLTDCRFENFPLPSVQQLENLLIKNPALAGLAVTIPYKLQVVPFLTDTTNIPVELGACNCIKIRDGRLVGFNTDYIGFEKSIQPLLQTYHQSALVLGNGGATRAVTFVLKRLGIHFNIVSRTKKDDATFTYDDVTEEMIKANTVIINTTPLGMYPNVNSSPDIPYEAITTKHLLYDLVYNPEETLFLKRGKEAGATIKNGADMLSIQAEENWKIWNR